jgi:hypothetical protein
LRTGPGAQALVVEGQGTARDVDELSQPRKEGPRRLRRCRTSAKLLLVKDHDKIRDLMAEVLG